MKVGEKAEERAKKRIADIRQPDLVASYFKMEIGTLIVVTLSGILYNIGLLAGPWFEGKLAQCLLDIFGGKKVFSDMLWLAVLYVTVIAAVQVARYVKRLYVRRFANDVNRNMKRVLYGNLVHKSKAELDGENVGSVMTKAISDVDACAEGMRKFTTEVFDTGVALLGYVGLLLRYDWRLALLSLIFPPFAYLIAEKMKTVVQKTGAAYKESAGQLNAATLDRVAGALTYRVFGCEDKRDQAYEERLDDYERRAVRANIWVSAMPPLYKIISMISTLLILYFGAKNVSGTGWTAWDIAAFTTFLSCFTKLSDKSSKAAKLFNSVQKAEVSWKRIKPLMKPVPVETEAVHTDPAVLTVEELGFAWPETVLAGSVSAGAGSSGSVSAGTGLSGTGSTRTDVGNTAGERLIFGGLSFTAEPGQIIGVTGAVACGKSTLGKAFLCEHPYMGSIRFAGKELAELPEETRCGIVGFMGHEPELLSDSIRNNVLLGNAGDAAEYLRAVCLDGEVAEMPDGENTRVGSGGVRLSGGQQARLALARTLAHKKPLLVLDDPFSALDRRTEREVFANLKKLAGDSIIILISHRLYLFPEMDQVIWMEGGRTITGTHGELLQRKPQYANLYLTQCEGGETDV